MSVGTFSTKTALLWELLPSRKTWLPWKCNPVHETSAEGSRGQRLLPVAEQRAGHSPQLPRAPSTASPTVSPRWHRHLPLTFPEVLVRESSLWGCQQMWHADTKQQRLLLTAHVKEIWGKMDWNKIRNELTERALFDRKDFKVGCLIGLVNHHLQTRRGFHLRSWNC